MYIPVALKLCAIIGIVEAQLRCGSWRSKQSLNRYTEAAKYEIGPSYDYYYGVSRCVYVIEPSQSNVYTVLKWREFDIDDDMPYCYKNYVRVSIGCGQNEKLIGKFCSRNSGKPFPIVSRDGCIRIEIKVDSDAIYGAAFKAQYITYSMSTGLDNYHCDISSYATDTLSGSSGLITSPDWPVGYNRRRKTGKCTWDISPSPERTNMMVYVFDADMNTQKSFGFDRCSTFTSDLVYIMFASRHIYEDKVCPLGKPKLYKYDRSSLYITFEVDRRFYKPSYGRGFVIGYMTYGETEEERKSKIKPAIDEDDSQGLSTPIIVVIVVISVFGCCGCIGGCCKYLLKVAEEDTTPDDIPSRQTENEPPSRNVEFVNMRDLQESDRYVEASPNSNHGISVPETAPLSPGRSPSFNPEFSEAGPPSYANLSNPSNGTTPSAPAPAVQYQPTVSNDDAPPPSYEDVLRGDFRC